MPESDALLVPPSAEVLTVQCAWCGLILRDHRTVARSHGICPACKSRVLEGR